MAAIWDGTGYGDDGTVWGGEFFLLDQHGDRIESFEVKNYVDADGQMGSVRVGLYDSILQQYRAYEQAVVWPGNTTKVPVARHIDDCPAGQFVDSSFNLCRSCSPGMYSNNSRATVCTVCTPGFFSIKESAVSCKPCLPGMFAQDFGTKKCSECDVIQPSFAV